MNEVYRFELTEDAFNFNEGGHGVGELNGGCDNRMVRKRWEGETTGGAIVYASAPSFSKTPQLLPSTGEMISDYDLYKRHIIRWFEASKHNIHSIPGKKMVLESFITDYTSVWDAEVDTDLGNRGI
jgi:hypothetical protein